MDIELEPGKYVVAVSGGVDSVTLLHMLADRAKSPELRVQSRSNKSSQLSALSSQLIVAHLDHGIREDSNEDRRLVQKLSHEYGLPFIYHAVRLGPGASEEAARRARYKFLHKVRQVSGAKAIIMAHHQDDLLETALINLIRGTGRRGLSSLQSTDTIIRPFLGLRKHQLIAYAKAHQLPWREDSTNDDTRHLRNHIRHKIMPKVSAEQRQQLLEIVTRLHGLNRQIDHEIINHLHVQPGKSVLDRHWFIMLPHMVSVEIMAHWLRQGGIQGYDKKTLERLVTAAKVYRPRQFTDIDKRWQLAVNKNDLALVHIER